MKHKKLIYIILGFFIIVAGYSMFSGKVSILIPVVKESSVTPLKDGDVYNLTASRVTKIIKGYEQEMLAYNGSIPGPTIRVKQGSLITINFKNNTGEPQLLHSHGVRMDNQYDGSQMVQKEIPAGGSFSYTLKFPDAGVYWYHPHAGEVAGQALGLYGAFIVEPSNPKYFPQVNEEQTLFLSDIPVINGVVSINAKDHALMGHYGNVMLVNGSENYLLSAKQGEVMRLYVINSANVRPFNFAIGGAIMKLVGGDSGAYEKASFVNSVLLAPSERAVVDVYFPSEGDYTLQNKTPNITYTLGTVKVSAGKVAISYLEEFNQMQTNLDTVKSINPFRKYATNNPDKRIKLTIDMMGGMSDMGGMMRGGAHMMPNGQMMGGMMGGQSKDGIEWEDSGMNMGTIDTVSWKIVDQDTGKENMDIHWDFLKDNPVVIDIYNDPNSMHPMQHPIHFHGQRFLVVARNGVPQTNLVWKDTTLVKIGETVRIVLDPSNVGEWMAHCHISEHLASGMMFGFSVK